jgi:hypothetical protein
MKIILGKDVMKQLGKFYFKISFGVPVNNKNVCYKNGNCIGFDVCECFYTLANNTFFNSTIKKFQYSGI